MDLHNNFVYSYILEYDYKRNIPHFDRKFRYKDLHICFYYMPYLWDNRC